MARSDLLMALVRAALAGDDQRIRAAVQALSAEERQKRHRILADQLTEALHEQIQKPRWEALTPTTRESSKAAGTLLELEPKLRLYDLTLPPLVRGDLEDFLEEQHRADLLRTYGVEPRHRVLLTGPPGNGKTSTAEALATELALPLLVLRYEEVITSYLGETSSRIEAALDLVRSRHCVFFLDEFDALAKERSDAHETGEIKRVVSSFLLQLDRLPSYVIVCAATNHPELLDRAVWRRFQLHANLPAPNKAARGEYVARLAELLGVSLGRSAASISQQLGPTSFAELREFVLEIRRRQILSGEARADSPKVTDALLRRWKTRVKPTQTTVGSADGE